MGRARVSSVPVEAAVLAPDTEVVQLSKSLAAQNANLVVVLEGIALDEKGVDDVHGLALPAPEVDWLSGSTV